MTRPIHIGCAGWSIPTALQGEFGAGDSHLARYATRQNAVEINSSFYRAHRRQTYERWASATPGAFAFSVKVPKAITHERRLVGAAPLLDRFLEEARGLGEKLGCLLVQLPPSLVFESPHVGRFSAALRRLHRGEVAVEARHATWFEAPADRLLATFGFGRVLADPVLHDAGRAPGGSPATVYLRLHGSPRMYWSRYEDSVIDALATRLLAVDRDASQAWCIFDNSADGESVSDALRLKAAIAGRCGDDS